MQNTAGSPSMERPDSEEDGVWFIYDGECPICSMAARALRIRQIWGQLHLINARAEKDHPLVTEINNRHLDLDEGMVVYFEHQFYHGEGALRFMAEYGEDTGWFNIISKRALKSEKIARLTYPWMRASRNLLLKLKGAPQIGNLRNNSEPMFKPVFGKDWDKLPVVLKRHYANRAYHNEVVTVEGHLDVVSSPIGNVMRPLFRLARTLVPYEGRDVPVTVHFRTDENSAAFRFDRIFNFPGKKPYNFRSAMFHLRGNEIYERMGLGLSWRAAYVWDGEKIDFKDKGYALCVGGFLIPLPLSWLIGKGYAYEKAIDNDSFSMMMELRHPLWGMVFGYRGNFKITKDA